MESPFRSPQILVPLKPLTGSFQGQDIVLYLRPESNGVQVESVLFRVFSKSAWKKRLTLAYFANLPGEFILHHRIVEHHYASRLDFAARGKIAFTPQMRQTFERFFGLPYDKAQIYGSFEALQLLKLSAEELFQLWVPVYDILEIEGQLVKRLPDNKFIINYDIPALLHKNHAGTDVAVLVVRTDLDYDGFRPVVEEVRSSLIEAGLLDPTKTERRVFHYSKGPFEQLLDGLGYIWKTPTEPASLFELSFGAYLAQRGWTEKALLHRLRHPITWFYDSNGALVEQNIFAYTLFDDYQTALQKISTSKSNGEEP
jgi:hypothetical protein